MKRAFFLVGLFAMVIGLVLLGKPQLAKADTIQPDLEAMEDVGNSTIVPSDTTSVQAATVQNGWRTWMAILRNEGQTPVTNATVSFMSGYDPSLFASVPSFPFTSSVATLAPGDQIMPILESAWPLRNPVSYSLGYDSSRIASPTRIPIGGTQQTVTVTLKLVDSRYSPIERGSLGLNIIICSNVPGVTAVSTTSPTNLDQGANIYILVPDNPNCVLQWNLGGWLQLDKTYTFVTILKVPNQYGIPFEYRPLVQMGVQPQIQECDACAGPSVTVADPTFDGPVPYSGAVTFSIAETNHTWVSSHSVTYDVHYDGTQPPNVPTSKDQCKKGGWQSYGIFKNQGDCVSFVATHGKNPPDGNSSP